MALARCSLAASLGRDADVVEDTEGLLNADDLSAALLLVRARSLRRLGANAAARAALQEVLRRRKTDFTLRSDALTDRALLLLDNGRKALNRRDWQRRQPAELETVKAIRKDAELHELWDREVRPGRRRVNPWRTGFGPDPDPCGRAEAGSTNEG